MDYTAQPGANTVRLINCTEGGAFIQSMEHMTLADAATGLDSTPIDIDVVLDRAVAAFAHRKLKKLLEALITRMQRPLNCAVAEGAWLRDTADAARNQTRSISKAGPIRNAAARGPRPGAIITA